MELQFPERAEREALWRSMIPRDAEVRGELPWTALAELELGGGNIGNAVMRAAFGAAARGEPIDAAGMLRAAALGLEAMGRLPPAARGW